MRRAAFALLAAIVLLSLCACTPGYLNGLEATARRSRAQPDLASPVITSTPIPDETPQPMSAYPAVDPELALDCLAVAARYRELIFPEGSEIPAGISLNAEERGRVRLRLGELGLAAFDAERGAAMTSPELVYDFFQDLASGRDASLSLYEVCHDGGLLRRDLTVRGDERTLTLTRLVWTAGEARITLSEAYYLTELSLSDEDVIISDYSFPDNIPGTNHDGHVETRESIPLRP